MSSSLASLCSRGSFLCGFLPGVLIGVFSSMLLFSIWQHQPIASVELDVVLFPARREPLLPRRHEATRENASSRPRLMANPLALLLPEVEECEGWRDCLGSRALEAPVVLLVLVHSTPSESAMRDAVRETWLASARRQQAGLQSAHAARFVIGTKGLPLAAVVALACENKRHGDMVLLPGIRDSLPDLPSADKLLASFAWAEDNADYSFLLKCNSASFILVKHIVSSLRHRQTNHSLLWGFFAGNEYAEKEGLLGEQNWYLCTAFLPYPQGGGYIITRDLVQLLVRAAPDLERFTHDDVALGVWLAPVSGIERKHDVRFNSGYYSRGCNNVYVVTHRETARSMRAKVEHLARTGRPCSEEVQTRLSYVYNWNTTASRCCVRQTSVP